MHFINFTLPFEKIVHIPKWVDVSNFTTNVSAGYNCITKINKSVNIYEC